jgi:hypothetical protein
MGFGEVNSEEGALGFISRRGAEGAEKDLLQRVSVEELRLKRLEARRVDS